MKGDSQLVKNWNKSKFISDHNACVRVFDGFQNFQRAAAEEEEEAAEVVEGEAGVMVIRDSSRREVRISKKTGNTASK